MKVYPTTNTIRDGEDIKPETINELTRDNFELANGGIDEYNLFSGGDVAEAPNADVDGLQSKHFENGAWQEYFVYPDKQASQSDTATHIDDEVVLRGSVGYDDVVINNVSAGFITGTYQICYAVPALEYENEANTMGYSRDYYKHNATHSLTLQANGAIIGETENIGICGWNHCTIPFAFYHSGGDIRFGNFVQIEGGGVQANEVATKRFFVYNVSLYGQVRCR